MLADAFIATIRPNRSAREDRPAVVNLAEYRSRHAA